MKLYNIIALLSLPEKTLNSTNQIMIRFIWIKENYQIIKVKLI